MSMSEPSGAYDVHDVAYCARCDQSREGVYVGDPTKPMTFRCSACEWETAGAEG
jgi:hypothetical protein